MSLQSGPTHSPGTENDADDMNTISDSHNLVHEEGSAKSVDQTPEVNSQSQPQPRNQPVPRQKRKRVLRACDECRREKIGCDGKQPCTHCTVYGYDCTYNHPSRRSRNPAKYIEALEERLQKAEALLRVTAPDLDLNDPRLSADSPEHAIAAVRAESKASKPAPRSTLPEVNAAEGADEALLETMMGNFGSLDLDDQGHWDYHGHSSTTIFIQRLQNKFGNLITPQASSSSRPASHTLENPNLRGGSRQSLSSDPNPPSTCNLPSKEAAKLLCQCTFDQACVLMRFVHEPSFWAMFDRIYATTWNQFGNAEHTFLPLLYIVMGVGCLFFDDSASTLDIAGFQGAIAQGFQYFGVCRQLLDITDCRDLTTLQAICFMVMFLQSSAKLSTCYTYIGIAQRAALRLGLHRSVVANFNPVEAELRKRIFWVIRSMDVYVSALLGLPVMVSNDDIDQEYPLEIDDEYITLSGILPTPAGQTSLMAGANAHTRLVDIVLKVVKYIYPVRLAKHQEKSDRTYKVSHSKIREIEKELDAWMESLPLALRPGSEVSPEMERMRQLLRLSYAHVQWVMYRPFLHAVSKGFQSQGIDKRSYACAAACVSVSRSIVHITSNLYKKGLLNGSYWFGTYTTYFAVLTLVFCLLENPDLPTGGILKDALEGKETLVGLAKNSMAAERCARLYSLFEHLTDKVKSQQSSSSQAVNLKHRMPSDGITRPNGQRPLPGSLPSEIPPLSNSSPVHLATLPSTQRSVQSNIYSVGGNYKDDRPQTFLPDTLSLRNEPRESRSSFLLRPQTSSLPSPLSTNPPAQQPTIPSEQFDASQMVPDLMPIMFPSGDPFAYPAQPMSTLESRHFKDGLSEASLPFFKYPISEFNPSFPDRYIRQNIATFDSYPGTQVPPREVHTRIDTGFPSESEHLGIQSEAPTPGSHSSIPENVQGPDLVSVPHNFTWQQFGFPPQNTFTSQPLSQGTASGASDGPNDVAGPNGFDSMGMDFAMDANLDDIFEQAISGSTLQIDDWSQWTNARA